jgi:hypothetical protein
MFFEGCNQAISTIPSIGTDEADPEMPRKGGPDHHYDSCSYACAYNPLPSGKEDVDHDPDDEDDYQAPIDRGRFGYG